MAKLRRAKDSKYQPGIVPQDTTRPDLSGIGAYTFDALHLVPMFYLNLALSNGVAITTIQDVWACPQRMVIVKLAVVYNTGAAYQVTDAFNIVKGTGALTAAAGTGQTVQAAGNSVFAANQALGSGAISTNFNVS